MLNNDIIGIIISFVDPSNVIRMREISKRYNECVFPIEHIEHVHLKES